MAGGNIKKNNIQEIIIFNTGGLNNGIVRYSDGQKWNPQMFCFSSNFLSTGQKQTAIQTHIWISDSWVVLVSLIGLHKRACVSPRVHICETENWQLITTSTCANLSEQMLITDWCNFWGQYSLLLEKLVTSNPQSLGRPTLFLHVRYSNHQLSILRE